MKLIRFGMVIRVVDFDIRTKLREFFYQRLLFSDNGTEEGRDSDTEGGS